jgi:hypothetical protein
VIEPPPDQVVASKAEVPSKAFDQTTPESTEPSVKF